MYYTVENLYKGYWNELQMSLLNTVISENGMYLHMARFRKGEFIAKIRNMGYPTKEIAEMLYKDGGEEGQSKVRAMYSYLKKKGLLSESSEPILSAQNQNLSELLWHAVLLQLRITDRESFRNTVPLLRKRKTMAAGMLWTCRYPVRIIAVLLYGNDSEQSQKRVWAHISKFMKIMRRNATGSGFQVQDFGNGCDGGWGCGFPEQNLRSRVGVGNSTNKTCDFGTPTPTANSEPKNYNFWNPNPNPNPTYKFSKLCNKAHGRKGL